MAKTPSQNPSPGGAGRKPAAASKTSSAKGANKDAKERPRRRKQRTAATAAPRATVFAYRQGIGDCFLIALPFAQGPRDGRSHFHIMIDCGVVIGTPDAVEKMAAVVKDVRSKLGPSNHLDVLVATHEHWDHLSGFIQAQEEFDGLSVGEIWLPWTEDPDDALARKLLAERDRAIAALRFAVAGMRLSGDDGAAADVESVLGFFGAAKGRSTKDALDYVRSFSGAPVRYHKPGGPPIVDAALGGARIFVLGPPHDEALLKRTDPRRTAHEGYELDLGVDDILGFDIFGGAGENMAPFHPMHAIPMAVAAEMPFFKSRYWGAGAVDDGWRRIDAAHGGEATELALKLDHMTNNTSLVLAIELDGGDVLLFVADAQVGNWLSWKGLAWETDRGPVSGPDLLERTVFYKVGHHGSHNATLKADGLERMSRLQVAFIPVDHAVAVKKGWGRMPLDALVEALEAKAPGRIFRSDQPAAVNVPGSIRTTDLYFELTF